MSDNSADWWMIAITAVAVLVAIGSAFFAWQQNKLTQEAIKWQRARVWDVERIGGYIRIRNLMDHAVFRVELKLPYIGGYPLAAEAIRLDPHATLDGKIAVPDGIASWEGQQVEIMWADSSERDAPKAVWTTPFLIAEGQHD